MSSYLVQRKLHQCSKLKALSLFLLLLFVKLVGSEERVPTSVQRRLSGDIVYFRTAEYEHESCRPPNSTYIVNERRCESNGKLFNGNNA